jgi:prepilin-type N-terminal cleavage/methylation domain-containing protein
MKNAKRAFTLVEIMIVVLIIGILLAIAVPNFIRAREQSRAKSCSSNLKQIDAAKEQYAMDNKLNAGGTVDMTNLVNATTPADGYIKVVPACPANGSYTVGNVSVDPTCSLNSGTLATRAGGLYPHTVNGL